MHLHEHDRSGGPFLYGRNRGEFMLIPHGFDGGHYKKKLSILHSLFIAFSREDGRDGGSAIYFHSDMDF